MTYIPLVDLKAQLKPIRTEIDQAIGKVLDNCNYILGSEVQDFERHFAEFCGARFAVGVASGTDALHLAMRAAGISEGDEVIVPANTFIATAIGVTLAGARPVIVDTDETDFLMDVEKIERAITPRTKAILPVHLYGRMQNLTRINEIAKKHHLLVIEDASQAHGSEINGARAGSVGNMGCFSFYPGKNLGCAGDGGAITTNDESIKLKIEAVRNYGSPKKYHHPFFGTNSRLDTLQAAILNVKLQHLDNYNQSRRNIASFYNASLQGVGDLILPENLHENNHVFHLYVIRSKKRDALLTYLNSNGIGAGIHYPVPLHLHGAYENLGYKKGDFPVAEKLSEEILSLPIFPEMSEAEMGKVVQTVREFF